MRAKSLLNKLEGPEDEGSLVFLLRKNFHQDYKANREIIGDYVWADPTEVPSVTHSHEVFSNSDAFRRSEGNIITLLFFPQDISVHADADAYLVTIQTIAVKPPWIDSVANGRANIFQLDSAPSHKALKIQDCMNGREFSLSCHIKLMPAS
ncbi:hypothetical protein ACTXT7_013461 [Hymenolepis weldensis]